MQHNLRRAQLSGGIVYFRPNLDLESWGITQVTWPKIDTWFVYTSTHKYSEACYDSSRRVVSRTPIGRHQSRSDSETHKHRRATNVFGQLQSLLSRNYKISYVSDTDGHESEVLLVLCMCSTSQSVASTKSTFRLSRNSVLPYSSWLEKQKNPSSNKFLNFVQAI